MASQLYPGEVVYHRLLRLIRRMWWLPLATGLLLGLLAYGTTSVAYSRSVTIRATASYPELEPLGFKPDSLANALDIGVDAGAITGSDFAEQVRANVDSSVEATIAVDSKVQSVTISVTADSAQAASDALDEYSQHLIDSRHERFAQQVDVLIDGQVLTQATIKKYIASIDEQLDGLDPQGSLASALLDSRTDINGQLLNSEGLVDVLTSLRDSSAATAGSVSDAVAGSASHKVALGVAGFVFGAIAGGGVLYLMALSKRRVRSSLDVRLVSGLGVVAVLPTSPTEQELAATSTLLAAVAREQREIALVAVGGAAEQHAASIAAAISKSEDRVAVCSRADGTIPPATTSAIFLAVPWGQPCSDDVATSTRILRLADRSPIGAVLVDVPRSEVRHALADRMAD